METGYYTSPGTRAYIQIQNTVVRSLSCPQTNPSDRLGIYEVAAQAARWQWNLTNVRGTFILSTPEGTALKARVPGFLLPRRRYEVNEEMWVVKFAGPKIKTIKEFEWVALTVVWHVAGAWGQLFSSELRHLGPAGQSMGRAISRGGSNVVLFFQWRRVPKDWELSFVFKIRESESKGVPFQQIVMATLPGVMGETPSFVLLRWVGKNGAKGPRQFVKTVEKMFGKSAKSIIIGLNGSMDPNAMLQVPEEPEEKFRAVIDEIHRVDDEEEMHRIAVEEAEQVESLTEAA